MIFLFDYERSPSQPIRIRSLPFRNPTWHTLSTFSALSIEYRTSTPFGSRTPGIVDLEMDSGEWAEMKLASRLHWVLCRTADHLGIGRPVPLSDISTPDMLAKLLIGEPLSSEVEQWLYFDASFLWGVFLAPRHAGYISLNIDGREGETDDILIWYLLMVGTGKVSFGGTEPPWSDEDMLRLLQSLGKPVLDTISDTVFLHLCRWRFRKSLDYLIFTTGRIYLDESGSFSDVSPEVHPVLTSIALATNKPVADKALGLDNILLTDNLIRGLLAASRGISSFVSFCYRDGSLLKNPGLAKVVCTFQENAILGRDRAALGLADALLNQKSPGEIASVLRDGFDIKPGPRRWYNRRSPADLNFALRTILYRTDIPKDALGNFVLAATVADDKLLKGYEGNRVDQKPGEFGPPLHVDEGVLRGLFRKPVRMCMLGHWLSDAGISVDTTPVLGELPVLVRWRLANPKYPDGLEYWINQMARDHDRMLEAEKEKDGRCLSC